MSVSLDEHQRKLAGTSVATATGGEPSAIAVQEPRVARRPIWIDLDNSPHVPFFRPVIRELEARGYPVVLTARDCFQVFGLTEQLHLECKPVGRHYGKRRVLKFLGLGIRTLQLLPSVWSTRPALAVSHGSRSQLLAAKLLGIPSLQIVDYEFAKIWLGIQPNWVMTPAMIPDGAIKLNRERVLKYPGIKEDVYVPSFTPVDGIRNEFGIGEEEILVTVRPPATEAHYHSPQSDVLFKATMEHVGGLPATRMIVLPRTKRQGEEIRSAWPNLFATGRARIPDHVVDGLNLIWYSDLVISGGGTMNREAAALGVPVYSIFRGKIGAIDHFLAEKGRLVLLEGPQDLATKLVVRRRRRPTRPNTAQESSLNAMTHHITHLAELGAHSSAV